VEVPALLIAIDRIIRGIEIDHDADRRLAMSFKEEIDEQVFDRARLVVELVVPVLAVSAGSKRSAS
jgi:hypothetical protein